MTRLEALEREVENLAPEERRRLRCLVISDQLIRGVANYGACHDVYRMTEHHGSVYLESEFASALPEGAFDLVLISGHATAAELTILIDDTKLSISKHLNAVRSQVVYLNACNAGRNQAMLAECFTVLNAQWVVAPVVEVPWGQEDNVATRIFARCLLAGLDVDDAVRNCDDLWRSRNPYRVFHRAGKA